MNTTRTPAKRFYCYPASNQVEGPFLLVELAGLLRANHITGETLTMAEGEEEWIPFQKRNEFHLAKEIPHSAIERHMQEHAEAHESPFTWAKLKVFIWVFALPLMGLVFYLVGKRYLIHFLPFLFHHDSSAIAPPLDTPESSN